MSGTSMASPQVAGMAALIAQYIQENHLDEKTGLSPRHWARASCHGGSGDGGLWRWQRLLSRLRQGSGLANIGNALAADTYLLMEQDATASYADGKIKAELGWIRRRRANIPFPSR